MKNGIFGGFLLAGLVIMALGVMNIAGAQEKPQEQPELADSSKEQGFEKTFYSVKKYDSKDDVMRHVEVETIDRDPTFLLEDKEKISVINYWAPWCSGCVAELPTLRQFQEKHKDVRVIYVADSRSGYPSVKQMADQMGLPKADSFYDARGFFKRWLDVGVYPTTIIVTPKGQLLYLLEGEADWSLDASYDFIKNLE